MKRKHLKQYPQEHHTSTTEVESLRSKYEQRFRNTASTTYKKKKIKKKLQNIVSEKRIVKTEYLLIYSKKFHQKNSKNLENKLCTWNKWKTDLRSVCHSFSTPCHLFWTTEMSCIFQQDDAKSHKRSC